MKKLFNFSDRISEVSINWQGKREGYRWRKSKWREENASMIVRKRNERWIVEEKERLCLWQKTITKQVLEDPLNPSTGTY